MCKNPISTVVPKLTNISLNFIINYNQITDRTHKYSFTISPPYSPHESCHGGAHRKSYPERGRTGGVPSTYNK